jgi:MinD superfamily P-loop ATPase
MDWRGLSLDKSRCDECGLCARICPLGLELPGTFPVGADDCLGCLYCYCVCPRRAIDFQGEPGFFAEQERQYDALIRALYNDEV